MTSRPDTTRRDATREELYRRVEQGDLELAETVRMMRRVAGKTQAEYATLVGISPRVLIDFERGVGNPTLQTLRRLLEPFGLDLTVRRRGLEHVIGDDLAQSRRALRGAPQKVLPELRRRVVRIANDSRVESFLIGRSESPPKGLAARGANRRVVRLYVTRDPSQASEVAADLVRTMAGSPKFANDPRPGEPSASAGTYVYVAMTIRR